MIKYNCKLLLSDNPAIIRSPPSSLTPDPESRVELPCLANGGSGVTLAYRWTKDGVIVENNDGQLTIQSIQVSDNGVYECSLVASVAGINSAPLIIPLGSTTLTVGGQY